MSETITCDNCNSKIDYFYIDIKAMAGLNHSNSDIELSYFFMDTAKILCPECMQPFNNIKTIEEARKYLKEIGK